MCGLDRVQRKYLAWIDNSPQTPSLAAENGYLAGYNAGLSDSEDDVLTAQGITEDSVDEIQQLEEEILLCPAISYHQREPGATTRAHS